MLADQGEISQDSVILDGFRMEDLNIDALSSVEIDSASIVHDVKLQDDEARILDYIKEKLK